MSKLLPFAQRLKAIRCPVSSIQSMYIKKYSTEAMPAESVENIPVPKLDDEPREYSTKITKLVNEISTLTLLEVKDLNDLLKKELNISDAPMMAAAALPMAAESSESSSPKEMVQDEFTIKLVGFNNTEKVKVIKCVKGLLPELNLAKAKAYVESLPQIVKKNGTKEEIDEIKKQLESVGATVQVD